MNPQKARLYNVYDSIKNRHMKKNINFPTLRNALFSHNIWSQHFTQFIDILNQHIYRIHHEII